MAQGGSSKKVANGLVAVSCGAVLAVYTAGYVRTRSAVDQFEAQAAERRAADPVPQRLESPSPEFRPKAPEPPPSTPVPAASTSPRPASEAAAPTLSAISSPQPEPVQEPTQTVTPLPPEPAPVVSLAVETATLAAEHKAEIPTIVPPAPGWKDGTYLGWGTSRHGNIQAEVVIERGRIASATIAQCRTRYSCSVIEKLPPEVAIRQSPDVDYVSGATQSANAFYFGVVDALSKAK